MADLAELDLKTKGGEARLRALLEDLVDYYKGVYSGQPLALAVWFAKSPESSEQNLLVLFAESPLNKIVLSEHQSLVWKTGLQEPPFANIYCTSVEYFAQELRSNTQSLAKYFERPEVLYFEKRLPQPILQKFGLKTEPDKLVKGWYVADSDYHPGMTVRQLLASRQHLRPSIGLVKTREAPDFENCSGLIHVEISQRWLPLSSSASLAAYTYYNDWQDGRPGYFLFEGGSFYQITKFEVKTAPDYSELVLEKSRDDRYAEVYLRAVHPPEQSAA